MGQKNSKQQIAIQSDTPIPWLGKGVTGLHRRKGTVPDAMRRQAGSRRGKATCRDGGAREPVG